MKIFKASIVVATLVLGLSGCSGEAEENDGKGFGGALPNDLTATQSTPPPRTGDTFELPSWTYDPVITDEEFTVSGAVMFEDPCFVIDTDAGETVGAIFPESNGRETDEGEFVVDWITPDDVEVSIPSGNTAELVAFKGSVDKDPWAAHCSSVDVDSVVLIKDVVRSDP